MCVVMVKYTTGELIKVLERFPKDILIDNDINVVWNYPENIRCMKEFKVSPIIFSQENATKVGLFEKGDYDAMLVNE